METFSRSSLSPSAFVGKVIGPVLLVSKYIQSSDFRPVVYSMSKGFRVKLLTNQGSDRISPVYRTALLSLSNTSHVKKSVVVAS